MKHSDGIRELTENDNYDGLLRLINQTATRFNPDPTFKGIGMTNTGLKDSYCSSDSHKVGYVVEEDDQVIAVMGVTVSGITSNGYLEFGVAEGHEEALRELVEKCASKVKQKGGEKLFRYGFSKFGQIRNREITLWEQLGFQSEEFSTVIVSLDLRDWNEPGNFHNKNIYPATGMELSEIRQILLEDGEDVTAELVSKHFVTKSPDQIVLTLVDDRTKELAGIAFYRIMVSNEDSDQEFCNASGFGVHFRPKFHVDQNEKDRLLHASLLSMQQLGVYHVYSRISLSKFDMFTMLIREGFDDPGFDHNCAILLSKTV